MTREDIHLDVEEDERLSVINQDTGNTKTAIGQTAQPIAVA